MLSLNKLSFWELETYFNNVDHVVVGAGIVGFSTALSLRVKYPDDKILIIERGNLPTGASTKNAGFACFGSPTELISDINKIGEKNVKELIKKRWDGLSVLLKNTGKSKIDYQNNGSFEIFKTEEHEKYSSFVDKIDYLNKLVFNAIGKKNTFEVANINLFKFKNISGIIKNNFEGQIDTGKMMQQLYKKVIANEINCLFNITLNNWADNNSKVELNTSIGDFNTKNLYIATNGLSHLILDNEDVEPARAQVLITTPLKTIPFEGTFHYEEGFYYFRNIGNRVLLGGGRNLDLDGETTSNFENTSLITNKLKTLLREVILPNTTFEIEHQWSGIMGVGKSKEPIIKRISPNVFIGIRLGGMGVALGSLVGEELALIND